MTFAQLDQALQYMDCMSLLPRQIPEQASVSVFLESSSHSHLYSHNLRYCQ